MVEFPRAETDLALCDELARFYADPLGFVLWGYQWGEGELNGFRGPDTNQCEFLGSLGEEVRRRKFNGRDPVMPILMSETSGHGTGKSALAAWLGNWILSTRPHSMGTVTASTYQQLKSRTWAAMRRWTKLCVTAHWFEIRADGIYHKVSPHDWKVELQTCKEENAQSFAGQHAINSTSFYIFDESSHVPDEVWKVAMGGMTDGEPMMFAWGQCARNTGQFYRVNFGSERNLWNTRRVDSRTSAFTNKTLIEQWIKDYGEDSDFVRVRVLGLPPRTNELQYIDGERIKAAQNREWHGVAMPDEPLIAGFDVSGGGSAWNVIRYRRGFDARSIPPVRIMGEVARTPGVLVGKVAELLSDRTPARRIAAMFVDAAFGAEIVARLQMLGHKNVFAINFGDPATDDHFLNMRSFMYGRCKEWLEMGCIPDDSDLLGNQLGVPGMHHNSSGKIVLESKKDITGRGEDSPDDADALVLTFARKVAPEIGYKQSGSAVHPAYQRGGGQWS